MRSCRFAFWSGHVGWCCCRVLLQGAAAGCHRGVLLQCALERACSCCCRVSLQGVAAGCFRVLLSERCVRFGAALLQGAAAGRRCKVLLLGWCMPVYALWSWPAGAAIGCCCRCCQSAVCLVVVQGRHCCGTWVLFPRCEMCMAMWGVGA